MISVVIVNWNSGTLLSGCLNSLWRTAHQGQTQCIVVDNGSEDGSERSIGSASFPAVELIKAGSNLGFAKACNVGAKKAGGDYILFLNPDAAVYPGTLSKVEAFMAEPANADVGICGVQLVDESGRVARSCARFPSPWHFVVQAIALERLVPKLGHFMSEWGHDQTRDVDQVMGAFFCVRRSVFDSLGGFDERFFVYFEEVDFSYRAKQAGWRTVYFAGAQAFHAGGGTSNQVKAMRLYYSLRSRVLYAFKHFSLFGAYLMLLTTLLVEPFSRTAYAMLQWSWSGVKETWAGYAMLWRWLPQWVSQGVTR